MHKIKITGGWVTGQQCNYYGHKVPEPIENVIIK